MRIVFATDLHGSELCFRKFINSGTFYKADVLILGGDLAGKAMCAIVEENGIHWATLFGRDHVLETRQELEEFEKNIRYNGFYPFRCTADELEQISQSESYFQQVFVRTMVDSMCEWLDWAEERLEKQGIECYAITGNDDPIELDMAFAGRTRVQLMNGYHAAFRDWQIFGYAIANPTPWDSPREKDEEGIGSDLLEQCPPDEVDWEHMIFNVHVPPYGSGLDSAPELTDDLQQVIKGGMESTVPVGSRALRSFIETYQPLLSLNGHVHESRGVTRIGRTLCINPGSRYNEGSLQAALIEVKGRKIEHYQFVTG